MPKDKSIQNVLVFGSGPIIIGQSAEFDYSGSQACLALREEGVRVVLVNSNPATIQTDLDMADEVYLEPLTPEIVEKIIEKEKPDAVLPTLSGQTGLNLAVALKSAFKQFNVQVIGTSVETIELAEDREKFRDLMVALGEPVPESHRVKTVDELAAAAKKIGLPVLLRPDYCLGGEGTVFVTDENDLRTKGKYALQMSGTHQVLVEKSVFGKAELEYEVIRDGNDNCITICSMENLDPVGVHTGESIVVAPAQTLSDDDHQKLRSSAIRIVRALAVKGACNIQFALDQETGGYWVIEVNPRASRSSALASKATGYPIARVAAKIALGYTLTEIQNKITGKTAAFEPALDYVVLKIPRWPFDKFGLNELIGTSMKSTGETMAIGKTFEESVCKAVRSLDLKGTDVLSNASYDATEKRLFHLIERLKTERVEHVAEATKINAWFLHKLKNLSATKTGLVDFAALQERKPVFNMVDTCAGEFAAKTPYYYSTLFADHDEAVASAKKKIVILGGGPIRIGQGIEFDYCTVKAIQALREAGFETIVVNNNPETVSTDFDVSDKLYFEPLTVKDVHRIIQTEKPDGVLVQFGGQTALNLAEPLAALGVNVLGTTVENLNRAGDRKQFKELMTRLAIPTVKSAVARSQTEALDVSKTLSFPLLLRPSFVLGGRAMFVVHNLKQLEHRIEESLLISEGKPVIMDEFLEGAVELDVDCLGDGKNCLVAGVMEQVEETGIHSGDSACVLPAQTLSKNVLERVNLFAKRIVTTLEIKGFCNIQMAVKDNEIYVIEVNPRASRTIPFVSKATGLPLAKMAALIQAGELTLDRVPEPKTRLVAVKAPVFPFKRFPLVDPLLNAEMKSTGETMGFGKTFAEAYLKALHAAGQRFGKNVFVDQDKKHAARMKSAFKDAGLTVTNTLEEADFAVSTEEGQENASLRRQCIAEGKTCVTSLFAALRLAEAIKSAPHFELVALSKVHDAQPTQTRTYSKTGE
ncbi:carbamoyl-phosphate synthase large subunit [Candidatus Micrarchaeota archaeon]|nr:carbamoyl-phosphate synthase large subunit [Candidatus Micrarchaeota archaeon]